MRRQRAFLNAEKEGQWEILHGSVKREFFCVKQPEIGCKNFFKSVDGQKLISAGGDWSIKVISIKEIKKKIIYFLAKRYIRIVRNC